MIELAARLAFAAPVAYIGATLVADPVGSFRLLQRFSEALHRFEAGAFRRRIALTHTEAVNQANVRATRLLGVFVLLAAMAAVVLPA